MGKPNTGQEGFTLVELILATLLLSGLCLSLWSLFGYSVLFWQQANHRSELQDNLRLSLNRMCREIRYARNISGASDLTKLVFTNDRGAEISYYCVNNQLLRRENGGAAPLAGYINNIVFSYTTEEGLVIDQTNLEEQKEANSWPPAISLITVTLTAEKPGTPVGPVTLGQKISLRGLR